jgi:hypothetical protein
VKIWTDQNSPFDKYKDLSKEVWARFVEKCISEYFGANNQYMQWLRSQNELDTTSTTPVILKTEEVATGG